LIQTENLFDFAHFFTFSCHGIPHLITMRCKDTEQSGW
jgi:hypothetical protein